MKTAKIFAAVAAALLSLTVSAKSDVAAISVVPYPQNVDIQKGAFKIKGSAVNCDPAMDELSREAVAKFAVQLSKVTGRTCSYAAPVGITKTVANGSSKGFLFYVDTSLSDEEYSISISKKAVLVAASSRPGFLYAIQTIKQMLPEAIYGNSAAADIKWTLPCVTIKDKPRFSYRGTHLDCSRHFFSVDEVKKFLDIMAVYKQNRFHWHLTDDQGWRIEVKKYPLLTQEGSWRDFDEYDKRCVELSQQDYNYEIDPRFVRNGSQYGGHYTQEEMKGLVSYALERGIDIVPEIDMPGHFSAAIKVYPELSCTGEAGWGEEFSYPICPSRPENYQFVQSIIDEMVEIFPSEYFHIGADEVEKDNWEQCEVCQQLMQQEGYQKVDELQNRFVKIMTNYVKGKGKKVMGWDDAFLEKDPQDLIYTYWRDWLPAQPGKITQKGYPIVFMEWSRFYLSATPSDEGLSSLYNFEFEPQFPSIVKQNVLGFQACVWTEMIPNERKFGQHVFPSLQAFSELAWGSDRNWIDFTNRLKWHVKWLNENGFYFTKPGFI